MTTNINTWLLNEIKNNKYKINKTQCEMIRKQRILIGLSANKVCTKLGFSEGWLARLERWDYKTIKGDKLIKLFNVIFPEENVLFVIDNFLSGNKGD